MAKHLPVPSMAICKNPLSSGQETGQQDLTSLLSISVWLHVCNPSESHVSVVLPSPHVKSGFGGGVVGQVRSKMEPGVNFGQQ